MAGFTDTLRGDGLARVQRALAGLDGSPLRLDRERQRFNHSPPPPYESNLSGTTTQSASPNPPSDEQRLHQERRMQLGEERDASKPRKQFSAQVEEERRRIWNADPQTNWIKINPGDSIFEDVALEAVKKRWVEQGIWNNNWNQFASGQWKHEEPLELESESESEPGSQVEFPAPVFSFSPKDSHLKPRQPKSDEEKRQIAERRVVRERERQASRPYHQFVYQISKERERIQDESTNEEGPGIGIHDINTRAYQSVKNTWTKRGIWNRKWGILPGMSWKHEEPLEEEAANNPALVQANLPLTRSHEVGEAPTGFTFGPSSPIESNHLHTSIMNISQDEPSTGIDSARLEDGNAKRSPFVSNSPHLRTSNQVFLPMTGQALQRSRKKPSSKHEQPEPVASASLGPAHSSKVKKAAGKKKFSQHISQKLSSSGLSFSSSMGVAEPQPSLDGAVPPRSNWIKPPSTAKDLFRTLSMDPFKRIARSKPNRNSAKAQDISKRQFAKTTRRKARKE